MHFRKHKPPPSPRTPPSHESLDVAHGKLRLDLSVSRTTWLMCMCTYPVNFKVGIALIGIEVIFCNEFSSGKYLLVIIRVSFLHRSRGQFHHGRLQFSDGFLILDWFLPDLRWRLSKTHWLLKVLDIRWLSAQRTTWRVWCGTKARLLLAFGFVCGFLSFSDTIVRPAINAFVDWYLKRLATLGLGFTLSCSVSVYVVFIPALPVWFTVTMLLTWNWHHSRVLGFCRLCTTYTLLHNVFLIRSTIVAPWATLLEQQVQFCVHGMCMWCKIVRRA